MNLINYNYYWGILHCHIREDLCHNIDLFSNELLTRAKGEIEDLYKFARDEMNYDFLAYADHHNMGKMVELGNAEQSPWKLVLDAWSKYNIDGKFVSILGYEYQDGIGEYNVYLNRMDMLPDGKIIDDLIDSVPEGEPGIIMAAHNRPNPTDWTFAKHRNFCLVEIINDGGFPFEEWVVEGLEAGHRIGFIGGSDDHGCAPGRNSSTCVLASSLCRDDVWAALEARRTVATTGIRPELLFQLNDMPMGSELQCDGRRVLKVEHKFEQCPEWIGIIKNGRLLEQYAPDNHDFSVCFEDNEAEREMDYYYLKVIYADGNYAFASPIWVSGKGRKLCCQQQTEKKATKAFILEKEFGKRIGRNKWFNASSLPSPSKHGFSEAIRDMVCHLGPDPILALPDDRLVYPTMNAIELSKGDHVEKIYSFSKNDENLVLTALCRVNDSLLVAGYINGEPVVRHLQGANVEIPGNLNPLKQFFYKAEFVSPAWLSAAPDGRFFCILSEREGILFTIQGKPLGYFQDSYPAFPVAVKIRSIDEIYILDLEGKLARYSFASATVGRLLWRIELGHPALSLALVPNGVLVYNGLTNSHNIERTSIRKILQDGSDGGSFSLDLMNRRGTAITALPDGRLAGLHNPNSQVSLVFREKLNEPGKIRIFKSKN
jgi:hypothetical protein